MAAHHLKIEENNFVQVQNGNMSFQLRKDDRDFVVGDVLFLQEINNIGFLTGRKQAAVIGYILREGEGTQGIKKGYALLNLSLRSLIVRDGFTFRTTDVRYKDEKCGRSTEI